MLQRISNEGNLEIIANEKGDKKIALFNEENNDAMDTSLGSTSEYAGTSNTSSYVKPSPTIFEFEVDIALNFRVNSGNCTKK
ncbi:MAG: hypothetical protein ACKO8Q_04865 [Bacteroidota bacterium]